MEDALAQVTLAFRSTGGRVDQVLVSEGQVVKKGDLLVKINPDLYTSGYNRTVAGLSQTKAGLSQADAQVKEAKANYDRNKKLFEKGMMVFGPYSADGFFGSGQYEKFDGILAAYHDQGLIPFKTLSFGNGVNYSAGLSKIRTSPDHGTAFEIAGKGEADNTSFKEAVYLAIDVYNSRNEYLEISKKPLKIQEKQLLTKKGE